MKTTQFINQLSKALVEKDVESIYRELLKMGIPDSVITSPYGGDGVLTSKKHNLIMLMEFKYNYALNTRTDMAKVLIQTLYYLKKSELAGDRLPSIIFVGDKDECFVIHSNSIINYLNEDIDWSIAPSSASDKNPELKIKLVKDENINPFVFDVDEDFDFSDVVNKILDLNTNVVRLVRITEKNVNKIFQFFCDKVIPKSKMDTNEKVGLFMNILTNPNENYIHPKKKNTLITPNGEVSINGGKFNSFFSHFEREYKPSEKEELVAIADRLIEDETRRLQGSYWTPTNVVDTAHEEISKQFGDNWYNEYVVWDTCSATANLTRDYKFKELYSSTLVQDEHDMKIQNNINAEGTHFVYDFLDGIIEEDKLPSGLVDAFRQNKPIIILQNPPYGTAKSMSTEEGDSKEGIALTKVNEIMKDDKMGACSQNLYAQFMYKLTKIKEHYGLTNFNICQFSPTLFLTGSSYKKFRKYYFNNFSFEYGFVVQASLFADVSSEWGIMFSIWKSGKTIGNDFEVEIKEDVEDKLF